MPEEQVVHTFTKEQKVGFALLLLFGVLAVGLGALQVRNTIYNPFSFDVPGDDQTLAAIEQDPNVRLQNIDTDQDGYSDYDELNFYSTSPYLPDTDSDGKSDKEEIEAGSDPTCAEGKPCQSATAEGSQSAIGVSPLADKASAPLKALSNVSSMLGATTTVGVESLLNDPSSLRSMLISSGKMSAVDLADISDEKLLEMFSSIVVKQSEQTATQGFVATSTNQ